jgi:hypothetical protein
MSLLQKFEKVNIKNSTLLPWEDKTALDELHRQYESTYEHLDEWRQFFELEEKRNPMPGFSIKLSTDRYGDASYYVSKPNPTPEDKFIQSRVYYGEFYGEIYKKIMHLKKSYLISAYNYIEHKYRLDIKKNYEELVKGDKINYMDVINDLRKQLGGLNFQAIAVAQIKKRFTEAVHWKQRAKLNGKNVELIDFIYYDYATQFKWDCKGLKNIEDAVMLFERGHSVKGAMFNSEYHYHHVVTFESDYTFAACEKLVGIRFFKNNKATLKFTDTDTAKAFYELFDLINLPERNW